LRAQWLLRRSIHAALLLLAVSVLSFLMARIAPGSFFDDLSLNPQIDPATIATLRARYGIDNPFPQRYAQWLISAARGDFGNSLAYHRPVAEILWPRAQNTLGLTIGAAAIAWLLALPLALLCAVWPRSLLDHLGTALSTLLISIPELLLALVLLYLAVRNGLPALIGGLALPLTVLAAGTFPILFSHARAALESASQASYITAARAHGIRGARLWFLFILPAAANPLISLLGLSVGGLIGASLVVEAVLSRPGLGPLFLEAIASRDLDVVTGVMLLSAVFTIAGNLLTDVLLGVCDPRVRSETP
jgi:peptide/nickel transport system permease protein